MVVSFIKFFFDFIVLRAPNYLSLILINLRSFYHLKKKVFYYDYVLKKFYIINNLDQRFYIAEKKRLNLYVRGFIERINILKNDYILNEIIFNDDDIILDCGANIGEFYFCFQNKVQYYGFEPGLNEFYCLKKNILNNSNLYNYGLWFEFNELKFYVNSEDADSSFVKTNNYHHIRKVKVKRLDSLFNKKLNIKLFKLEAEGCELEVLKGTENILKNIQYVSADLGYERGINLESTYESVKSYLLDRNFEIIKINKKRLVCLFKNNSYKDISKD